MFAAQPKLRDRLDLRSMLAVAAVAAVALALQLGLLAGTVASPLDQALAQLDRQQLEPAVPAGQALAAAVPAEEARPVRHARLATAPQRITLAGVEYGRLPDACVSGR